MGAIDCITKSGLADESKLKELSSKIEALVKNGKHPVEADAIVKHEFIQEQYAALNGELNGLKKKFGIAPGNAALAELDISDISAEFKTTFPKPKHTVSEAGVRNVRMKETTEADLSQEPPSQFEGAPIAEPKPFVSSKGHTVKFEDGELIVTNKKGEPVSDETRKKVLQEYADAYDFSLGETAPPPPEGTSFANENEAKRYVVENSRNPYEIADIYVNEEPQTAPLSTVERMIADYGIGKVTRDSYLRHGDKNNINQSKAKSYLNNDGMEIDVVAKELSDHYGIEITPQDIVDFMDRFPNGAGSAIKLVETPISIEAAAKFKQLTGLDLTNEVATKVLEQEFNKLDDINRQLIEDSYETVDQLDEAYETTHKASENVQNNQAGQTAQEPNTVPDADAGSVRRGTNEPELAGRDGSDGVIPPTQEAPVAPEETPYVTDIRHATLDEDAYGMGLKELEARSGLSGDELRAQADKLIEQGMAADIVKRALAGKDISIAEKAVLVKLKAAVDQEWETAMDQYDTAVKDGGGAAIHDAELKKSEIAARAQEIYQAAKLAGSQYGQGLAFQKMFSGTDYSIGEMLTRKQKAAPKGRQLTTEEVAEVEAKQKDIKTKEKKIKDKGKEIADAIRKLRIGKQGDSAMSNIFGLPIAIYDTAIITIANAVEAGANLADAIGQGVKYIKDNGGFKNKNDEKAFRSQVMYAGANEKRLNAQKARAKNTIERERAKVKIARFESARDAKIKEAKAKGATDDEIKAINDKYDAAIERHNKHFDYEKPPIELDKEAQELRVQAQHAKDDFELQIIKEQMKNRTVKEKIRDVGRRTLATSGALTSTFDDSLIGVQLYVAMIANPKVGLKAWVEHWRQFGSDKRFRRKMAELHNDAKWDLAEKSGLEILEPQSLSAEAKSKVEDMTIGSYHNEEINVKGVNVNPLQVVKPFERLFTSGGNIMRFELFKAKAQELMDKGMTFDSHPEEFKSIASVINSITGRGGMPTKLKVVTPYITPVMWSPSLFASSVNLLGITDVLAPVGVKGFYSKLTPRARKYAAAQTATALSVGAAVLGLFALAKAQGVEDVDADLDPTSPTFGNVRIGNKSYNAFSRFAGYAKIISQTLLSRLVSTAKGDGWKAFRTKDGEKQFLDEKDAGPYAPSTLGVLGSFARGKMRPTAGAAFDLMAGEHFFEPGKPYGAKDALWDVTTPISADDVIKNLERDPAYLQIINFALLFEGLKVSDTRDFEKKSKTSNVVRAPKAPEAPEAPSAPE
jgi:hypothetical protein